MAKKIKQALFIFLLLTFPVGEIAKIQFQNGVAVTAADVAVGLLVFVSVLKLNYRKLKLKRPLLIFVTISTISLLANLVNLRNSEIIIAALYLLRWVAYAGVYLSVANFDSNFKMKIPAMLSVMGAVVVVGGIIQYFFYPNLRNLYYLGWDEHLYRLFSSFLDPNFAGAFLVLYLLFVLGIFAKGKKLIYGFISIATLVGIVLTFSRSAYLMLFVGLFVFLFLSEKKKLIVGFTTLFILVVAVLAITGRGSEGTNLLRITSAQARLPSAANALAIFERNPILGVGFNAYEFAGNRYGLSKPSKFSNHSAAGTDNSFLFVLATTGIVGFISYLYIWFKIISFPNFKNKFSVVLISSTAALFVDSIFINSLFYTFIMLWMWILIGLSED